MLKRRKLPSNLGCLQLGLASYKVYRQKFRDFAADFDYILLICIVAEPDERTEFEKKMSCTGADP
jgi:hypothetical protein